MPDFLLLEFTVFAHRLADAAGEAIRPYFGQALTVEAKADHSPVSIADREAERVMRTLIEAHYPEHGIYGEEFGTSRIASHGEPPRSTYTWVIDPIDGTRAFLARKKEWGTLIALCEDGVPVLGVLDQPVTGERWVGVRGGGSTYSVIASNSLEKRIQPPQSGGLQNMETPPGLPRRCAPRNDAEVVKTRPCSALSEAIVSATYCAPPEDGQFNALAAQAKERLQAGDCYAYGLLARGHRDIVCDTALNPYDILALVPIIEGAGGVITGWDGAPVTLSHSRTALAAGDAKIHQEALAILTESV